jgi:phosphate transport system protein
MLRELISIFRHSDPLREMGDNFAQMLTITHDTVAKAGDIYFGKEVVPEERAWIYEQDIKVNQLERTIRQQVITHLALASNAAYLPYCLLLMSLVKDVERIGDYAKNLSEIADFHAGPPPEGSIERELREIRSGVETALAETADVFQKSDTGRAVQLIVTTKSIARRCDELVDTVARSDLRAGITAAAVLGARYYKRIGGHALNVLSGVVMPLHKLDYFDEDELPNNVLKTLR